jgi:hypothetical protein
MLAIGAVVIVISRSPRPDLGMAASPGRSPPLRRTLVPANVFRQIRYKGVALG